MSARVYWLLGFVHLRLSSRAQPESPQGRFM